MKNIKLIAALIAFAAGCSPVSTETTTEPPECPAPVECPAPTTCPTCTVCQVCPPPVACPPPPAYVDPCASDPVGAAAHYDDAHGVTFGAGGTVRVDGIAQQSLAFPVGQTIREVRVHVVPKIHSSLAHVHLPTMSMWLETPSGDEFIRSVGDPFDTRAADLADPTVAAEYSKPHDLVMALTENANANSSYVVRIVGEWEDGHGIGQSQDLAICGTAIEVTK